MEQAISDGAYNERPAFFKHTVLQNIYPTRHDDRGAAHNSHHTMTATERAHHLHLVHDATKPREVDLVTPHMARELIRVGQDFAGNHNNQSFLHHTSAWRQEDVRGGYLTVIANTARDSRQSHLDAAVNYLHTQTGILRVAAGFDESKGDFSIDLLTLPNSQEGVAVAEGFIETDMWFVQMESDLIQEVRQRGIPHQYDQSTIEKTARKLMSALQRIDTPTTQLNIRDRARRIASYVEQLVCPL